MCLRLLLVSIKAQALDHLTSIRSLPLKNSRRAASGKRTCVPELSSSLIFLFTLVMFQEKKQFWSNAKHYK